MRNLQTSASIHRDFVTIVAMTIFEHANQGGQSREIHGPVFENLADTWKNDKASSMKMWKK